MTGGRAPAPTRTTESPTVSMPTRCAQWCSLAVPVSFCTAGNCTAADCPVRLRTLISSSQVRPLGQGVADMRQFTVDSTPPVTALSSTLPSGASPQTSQDSVVFTFSARDLTAVNFSCLISLAAGAAAPPHFRSSQTGLKLGTAGTCVSPLTVWGLYYGSWTFVVGPVQGICGLVDVHLCLPSLIWARGSSFPS